MYHLKSFTKIQKKRIEGARIKKRCNNPVKRVFDPKFEVITLFPI